MNEPGLGGVSPNALDSAAIPTAATTPVQTVQPTAAPTPEKPGGLLSWLGITTSLQNVGLILVGLILALGALLVSQKDTVVQVAGTAAKVAI